VRGDPHYYTRRGFSPTVGYGLRNKNGFPDETVMARELIPCVLDGFSGEFEIL